MALRDWLNLSPATTATTATPGRRTGGAHLKPLSVEAPARCRIGGSCVIGPQQIRGGIRIGVKVQGRLMIRTRHPARTPD